jgi:hypothetical protein
MGTAYAAQHKTLGNHESTAVAAATQPRLFAECERRGEKHRVLEGDLCGGQHQAERSNAWHSNSPRVSPGREAAVTGPDVQITPSSDSVLASRAVSSCNRSERVK